MFLMTFWTLDFHHIFYVSERDRDVHGSELWNSIDCHRGLLRIHKSARPRRARDTIVVQDPFDHFRFHRLSSWQRAVIEVRLHHETRWTYPCHPQYASDLIDHTLMPLPSSSALRGHDRMGATPIREHGDQSSLTGF